MSLPGIGILDNLGGVLVHLLIGALIAALIFNAFGYSKQWKGDYARAKLGRTFLTVIRIHYSTQSFWFPEGRPWFYTSGLRLLSE
jgi:hypothetical protein